MITREDEYYMKKALKLAEKGIGKTKSNPMVGAIIIKNGAQIGEGYHKEYGGKHAEIEAFDQCSESPEGSTLYVNLEPCFHQGKTPPCVDAIIEKKVKRVVIGMPDPNPLVSGKSIKLMREQGIEVEVGVLEKEAKKLNEAFVHYITKKMPFVMMKSAITLDGKIATKDGKSKWITSENSRRYTRKLRRNYQGIMVGVDTVIADNPRLLADARSKVNPIRIIMDSNLRIPEDSVVVTDTENAETWILTTGKKVDRDKFDALFARRGVKLIVVAEKNGRIDLEDAMRSLAERGISSIWLEGGGTLNYSMLEAGLVSKALFIVAPKIFGGAEAKTCVEGEGVSEVDEAFSVKNIRVLEIKDIEEILVEGYISRGGGGEELNVYRNR